MIEFNYYEDIPKNFTGICKTINTGNIYHVKDGKIHNKNGPAVIYSDGSKRWYIHGYEHREDGPSTEHDGEKHWFYKGKYYGCNDEFTEETWKKKVEQLIREDKLKIFK